MKRAPRLGMVLAAGYGKRLRPLTDTLPKPLVELAGKPLLEHALDAMLGWGVEHVFVNSHHIGDKLGAWHHAYKRRSFVTLVEEPTLLGTGGGIRNALSPALDEGEHAVVSNGDVLFRPDVPAHFAAHQSLGAYASMVIRVDAEQERYGLIGGGEDGRMTRLLSEGDMDAPVQGMFSGVHILSKPAVLALPEQGCAVRQGYQPWFRAGLPLGALLDRAPWYDAGEYALFKKLEAQLASGDLRWPPTA